MAFESFLAFEASAGSGKTFNLVVRYLSLLFMGEDPESIVALTFTNKAANEMLERIVLTLERLEERGELGAIAQVCDMSAEAILAQRDVVLRKFLRSNIQISTIDTFLGRILRKFALNAGLMPTFATTTNHHEVKLMERFLNEVEVSRSQGALVHLSLLSEKRLGDLFGLLAFLYSKYKELDLDAYERAEVPAESIGEAMELAGRIAAMLSAKPLSDRSRATMEFDSFESLLEKTWVFKPTLEYWDFKKHFEPAMDDLLHRLQDAIGRHMRWREVLYFRELFAVLKLYIKSRRMMAVQGNELSFDDITLGVHTLLREKLESEFLYFRLDARIKHLLLDEFQDTSVLQFDILRPLIEEIRSGEGASSGGSFFFVGDVKQSIYRFRGGVSALFHQAARHFGVHVEPLRVNYRSRSEIVDFINRSFASKIRGYIPQQSPETLHGGYVSVSPRDDLLEGLGKTVDALLADGVRAEEIAILTVTNNDGSAAQEYLEALGHRVVTETTAKLIAQRSVRAIIEYLRYCYFDTPIYRFNCAALVGCDPDAIHPAAFDHPAEGAIDFIRRYAMADRSALMYVEALQRYRDVEEAVFEAERLETAAPQSDQQGIRIMTVHKSKGLEFEHVIVLDQLGRGRPRNDPIVFEYDGVALEGLFYRIKHREAVDERYARALETELSAAAEDRLNALYVALTRAVESLHVVMKEKSSWFEPLDLPAGMWGEMLHHARPAPLQRDVPDCPFRAERYGRQEETAGVKREMTADYAAVQFGLALHYALEMMAQGSPESMNTALESARNRYGAFLPEGGIERIRGRLERLMEDATFASLTRGEWRKEQPLRYEGSLYVIDLLVRHPQGWNVIDYKSGREGEGEHREQVTRYVEAVRAIFPGERVEGYLCYLLNDSVEWVKCL